MTLSDYYVDIGEEAYEEDVNLADDHLPFTVGDLSRIYESMAQLDGFRTDSRAYSEDQGMQAGSLELSDLFDQLSSHYE